MLYKKTNIDDVIEFKIEPVKDDRGFFARNFCKEELSDLKINFEIVQSNISYNKKKGTLRGMHLQKEPHGEMKIVRCTKGSIFDVVVDLRKDSSTYLKWYGVELSANNYTSLLIPKGCAHGFVTLEKETEVLYFMSEFFHPESASGYRWNDPSFKIDWPLTKNLIVSEKDKNYPNFSV